MSDLVDFDDMTVVVSSALHLEDGSVGRSRVAAVVAGADDLA